VAATHDDRPAPLLASPVARLAAVLVDSGAALVVWLGAYFLVRAFPVTPVTKPYLLGTGITAVVAFGLFQIFLLSRRGQTLGKMVLGVRIVRRRDGSNAGFGHAVILRYVVPRLIGCVPVLGQLFTVIDVLCIFGEGHRCLHDVIADTKVVEV
jgi:uncharacterized RDD family membrane protein YckC